jgi:hypothetical protein
MEVSPARARLYRHHVRRAVVRAGAGPAPAPPGTMRKLAAGQIRLLALSTAASRAPEAAAT